jgi:hypothetical protein
MGTPPGLPPGDHQKKPGPADGQRPGAGGAMPPAGGRGGPFGEAGPMPGGMGPGGMGPGTSGRHGGAGMMGGFPGGPFQGMGRLQPADREMLQLQEQDMALEQQAGQLAAQYQGAPKDEQQKIKKQVVELVNKQFEVRQQRRALELKRLESELKRLREIVDRRVKARKQLVDKRVAELVGPEEGGVEF